MVEMKGAEAFIREVLAPFGGEAAKGSSIFGLLASLTSSKSSDGDLRLLGEDLGTGDAKDEALDEHDDFGRETSEGSDVPAILDSLAEPLLVCMTELILSQVLVNMAKGLFLASY